MKKQEKKHAEIENLKNSFMDSALLFGTILGFVAFLLSLFNAVEYGIKLNNINDLLVLLIFAGVYIFRKKVRLEIKTIFIIIGLFLLFLSDFIMFGVYGDNIVLIIVLLFITFLVFRMKAAIWLFVLISVTFAVLAYLHITGILGKDATHLDRFMSIDRWIISFLLITIVAFAILLVIREFNKRFLKLIDSLEEKNKYILEKESNYTEIFNTVSNAIFIHDMNGNIVDVNDTMLKMYKYKKEDISTLGIEAISAGIAPYDTETAINFVREAIEKGEKSFEWRAKDKEGKVFWAEVILKKTKIGENDRVLALVKDIDEQKRTNIELEEYKNKLELKVKERTEELAVMNEELKSNNEELLVLNENVHSQKNTIEKNEKRLNTIIQNQGEGLGISDLNENLVYASASAHHIFGVKEGKLVGRNLKEFIDKNDWNTILEQTKKRKKNKKSSYEVKLTLKDGLQKHLIVTGAPDYDETGKIIGTIGNFRDITDRILKEQKLKELNEQLETTNEEIKETNEELLNLNENIEYQKSIIEEKERRLNTIINNQGEGLGIVNINETFLSATSITHEIFGVPEGKLVGRNLSEFIKGKDWEEILLQTEKRKRNVRSSYDIMLNLDNGQKKHIILTGAPDYDETGKVIGTIANFRDITDRILKEQKLKELNEEIEASNEELNEANEELSTQKDELHETLVSLQNTQKQLVQSEKMASLGVMAAGVAHEINNPLNFIMGGISGLEIICKDYFESNKQSVGPLVHAINEGVNRAASIVTGLNQFSRQGSSDEEDCDIHSIIDNCLTILHNKLKTGIEIIKNYQDSQIIIKGNGGKLHQIFLNILSNAEQSIKEKGTIRITTQTNNKNTIISVEDTGIGIKDEYLQKITDPFFTTKDPGEGTGLGLSIVHQVIEEHKGKIEFSSEVEKGTTVTIKLPIN